MSVYFFLYIRMYIILNCNCKYRSSVWTGLSWHVEHPPRWLNCLLKSDGHNYQASCLWQSSLIPSLHITTTFLFQPDALQKMIFAICKAYPMRKFIAVKSKCLKKIVNQVVLYFNNSRRGKRKEPLYVWICKLRTRLHKHVFNP